MLAVAFLQQILTQLNLVWLLPMEDLTILQAQ